MTDSKKRDCKANFSDAEIRSLLKTVLGESNVIQSKLQCGLTLRRKNEAWGRLVTAVNAASIAAMRSVDDCRRKWKDVKAAVLKEQLETGGGGPLKESPYNDLVWQIIGDRSDVVSGILFVIFHIIITLSSVPEDDICIIFVLSHCHV